MKTHRSLSVHFNPIGGAQWDVGAETRAETVSFNRKETNGDADGADKHDHGDNDDDDDDDEDTMMMIMTTMGYVLIGCSISSSSKFQHCKLPRPGPLKTVVWILSRKRAYICWSAEMSLGQVFFDSVPSSINA